MHKLYFTPRAKKDAKLIKASNLQNNTQAVSGRINKQHRLVYEVLENEQAIKVIMMWTHYE